MDELDEILWQALEGILGKDHVSRSGTPLPGAKAAIQALIATQTTPSAAAGREELRELLKTELFAAIEYGHKNCEASQDALEATWIGHLDDMMEYVQDYTDTLLAQAERRGAQRMDPLRKYLVHWGTCSYIKQPLEDTPCTCGLDQALASTTGEETPNANA